MPRKPHVSSYCLHKPSGQAYIRVRGQFVYLGVDGGSKLRRGAAEDPPKSRFASARVSGPKHSGGPDSRLHACQAVHLLCTAQ